MLAIIDYGSGNLDSVYRAFHRLGANPVVARTAADVTSATRLVLPGVGYFDKAMAHLADSGMLSALKVSVLERGTPILGICLGFQLFTDFSEEGHTAGLGWLRGRTQRFTAGELKVPHMGWNEVFPGEGSGMLARLDPGSCFYFAHSYYVTCDDAAATVATAEYGVRFAAAAERGNIVGTQFHPEISHDNGYQFLRQYLERH
jgi:glutamine amidotransferase